MNVIYTTLTLAWIVTLTAPGCGAPRDPDLERRAMEASARYHEERAAPPAASTPPAPVAAAELPVRTYSDEESRRTLGAVPGAGKVLWAEFRTQRGTIKCRLDEARAPQTVTNFVGLATGQTEWRDGPNGAPSRRPFYDGLTFHRIVDNFIIQTGNPGRRVAGGPGWTLPRETGGNSAFSHAGALSMVDAGDHSHGSQLFITVRADRKLAERYAAFGTCDQVDIVRGIANMDKIPTSDGRAPSVPRAPVKIFKVQVYRGD